jgi:F0F1-type ATP synthase epsilon subunit
MSPGNTDTESNKELLKVKVMNPVATMYDGSAVAVSAYNKLGAFDILPGHTRFITLIYNQLKIRVNMKKEERFELKRGVLRCLDNSVNVYVGI